MAELGPRPIATKADAVAYLDALERSYEIGGIAWSREFGSWWAEAGEEQRLAMLDILTPEDEARCENPFERSAAARAFAELAELRASLRERYVARRFTPDDSV